MKREALELSLKYSFVTPLTSMVVTKPEGGDTEVLHKPKEGEAPQTRSRHPNIGSCKQPNVNKANRMQNPVSRLRSQSNLLYLVSLNSMI